MRRQKNSYILFLLALIASIAHLSCQVPTEPTAVTVPAALTIVVHDQAGNALPGSHIFLMDSNAEGVTQSTFDGESSIAAYNLNVPILGENYIVITDAPPATTLTHYTPLSDTLRFKMPCHDTNLAFTFDRADSIPCGSLTIAQTLDLGTVCIDHDTTVNLSTGDFKQNCPAPATITSITTPVIAGLTIQTVFRGTPDVPVGALPAAWPSATPIAVKISFTSAAHQPVTFDGNDIVINAAPSAVITVHLKGKGINCDSCNCPKYDSVSFGLAPVNGNAIDTNVTSIGDPAKHTTVDLSQISNGETCNLTITRTKNFTSPELSATSFNGANGATSATLLPGASLGSLQVDFTGLQRGEVTDTQLYDVKKVTKNGAVSDCGSFPVIYHGHVGLGVCEFDTASTNASTNSYLRNDTVSNCPGGDEDYRYFCIRNPGDGTLRFTLDYTNADNQFFVKYDVNGAKYAGETVSIAPGGEQCFSIHFTPTNPGPAQFINTLNVCAYSLPVVGIAKQNCVNCLNGSITMWGVTPTSYQGFIADSNAFEFKSDQNAHMDVYETQSTLTSITFASLNGSTFTLLESPYTFPGPDETICDDNGPNGAIAQGKQSCAAGAATITAKQGDLLLFHDALGKCGLLFISAIYQLNGITVADFEAAYPVGP